MGLLDIFKKKEKAPDYDVTDLKIEDLSMGFILELVFSIWVIVVGQNIEFGVDLFSLGVEGRLLADDRRIAGTQIKVGGDQFLLDPAVQGAGKPFFVEVGPGQAQGKIEQI